MTVASNSPNHDRLRHGNTLLHTCTSLKEAHHLVARGANLNARNNLGQVPIHSLMRMDNPGSRKVIRFLLQLRPGRVYVNSAEPDGTTIAHLCEWGPIMSHLVANRTFKPNKIRASDGNTPLMCCITYPKHPDIAKRLLEDPRIDLTIRNPINGKTALEIAQESTTEYGKEILILILNKMHLESKPYSITPSFISASQVTPSLLDLAWQNTDADSLESLAKPRP